MSDKIEIDLEGRSEDEVVKIIDLLISNGLHFIRTQIR